MKVKARLEGTQDAKKALKEQQERLGLEGSAVIGFGTSYALAVHERVEVFHKTGGSKFLESAMHEIRKGYKRDLASRTQRLMKRGHKHPVHGAIYQKALQVESKAVKRTPVDTGRLRASHFVKPPKGA